MVVSVLYYPVDSVLLLVDSVGVSADDCAVLSDFVSHQLLIDSEVIYLETGLGVSLIIFHKLPIEFVSSMLKLHNLQLLRSDGSVQIFDFEVEHKLELLQLLSFLFEVVNLLLTVTNELVLLANEFIQLTSSSI